jgi:orsellinic acid C2-O-methyltransferase
MYISTETRQTHDPRSRETLLGMISGYTTAQVIVVAARLGIADILWDGPRGTDELAKATATHAPSLRRLLHTLACLEVLTEVEPDRFELTDLGKPLRSDAPDSVRALATMTCGDAGWRSWGELIHSIRTGQAAFEHVFGMHPFQYYGASPELAENFNDALADHTRHYVPSIVAGYDFSRLRTVVDVGGGNGTLIASVLSATPGLRGVLLDTAAGAAAAPETLATAGVADRCQIVEGDFFESVPSGADAYLLKSIIHDWDDDHGVAILANCRRVMGKDSRILVVEPVLSQSAQRMGTGAALNDLNMLVNTGGRERAMADFEALFTAAGFTVSSISAPLGAPAGAQTIWTTPYRLIEGVPA